MDALVTDEVKFQLIEVVRTKPVLYNTSLRDYRDSVKRSKCWETVAEEMDLPVAVCKKTWVILRDCYRRCMREERKARHSSSGTKQIKWMFFDRLQFLENHISLASERSSDNERSRRKRTFSEVPQADQSTDEDFNPVVLEVLSPSASQSMSPNGYGENENNEDYEPEAIQPLEYLESSPASVKQQKDNEEGYEGELATREGETSQNTSIDEDCDTAFAAFVRANLREIHDPRLKGFVRLKIHEILMKAKMNVLKVEL